MLVFTLVAILLHGMKTSDTIIVRRVLMISWGFTRFGNDKTTLKMERKPPITEQHLPEKLRSEEEPVGLGRGGMLHQKVLMLFCWESWGVGRVVSCMLLASYLIMLMKGSGYFEVEFGCWQVTSWSFLHPGAVSTEGRHTDGHCYRHLLWILVGSLLFHLFPGISVQCPNHDGADVVTVGMYGGLPQDRCCLRGVPVGGWPVSFSGSLCKSA